MRIPNIARRVSPWAVNRADGLSHLPGPQAEGDKEADPAVSEDAVPEDEPALRKPIPQRVVVIRPRSVLIVLLVLVAVAAVVSFFFLASYGLTVIAIALFFALALNPAVEFFQRPRAQTSLGSLSGVHRGSGCPGTARVGTHPTLGLATHDSDQRGT